MVLKFHKAEPTDLRDWATTLRQIANAMDVAAAAAVATGEYVEDDDDEVRFRWRPQPASPPLNLPTAL